VTTTEKKLYEHLKEVLLSLESVFDTDGYYTEIQLYASLDSAREQAMPDDEDINWYNMRYLREAMQGKPVDGVSDWQNLECAADCIANANRYLFHYEIVNDL
jgi:hypothetical protein